MANPVQIPTGRPVFKRGLADPSDKVRRVGSAGLGGLAQDQIEGCVELDCEPAGVRNNKLEQLPFFVTSLTQERFVSAAGQLKQLDAGI